MRTFLVKIQTIEDDNIVLDGLSCQSYPGVERLLQVAGNILSGLLEGSVTASIVDSHKDPSVDQTDPS